MDGAGLESGAVLVVGEYHLTSDAVVRSFRWVPMVRDTPEELGELMHIGDRGMMLFPGNQVGGKMAVNPARGCRPRIKDRFALTPECIRRRYRGETSPLSTVLERYADFFELFVELRGFVEYFLLQDAVTVDCDAVIFSAPLRGLQHLFGHPPDHAAEYCRLRALEDRS